MKPTFTLIAALALTAGFAQDQTQTTALEEAPMTIGGVSPHGYWIPRGSTLAGGFWDLFYSDNMPLVLQTDHGRGMSAQVMVEGRLPIDPTALSVTVETHATSRNIQQTVALWDWNANTWVSLGSDRVGSWDTALEYVVPGDFLRFSESGTGRIQAVVGFQAVGPTNTPLWQARVDNIYWTYGE